MSLAIVELKYDLFAKESSTKKALVGGGGEEDRHLCLHDLHLLDMLSEGQFGSVYRLNSPIPVQLTFRQLTI